MHFFADWLKQKACVSIQLLSKRKTLVRTVCATYCSQSKNVSFTLRRKFVPSLNKDNINEQQILLCLLIRKMLRRNPIGNKQFLVFSGPDRIILGTLQFFLRFLKANDINSCLK